MTAGRLEAMLAGYRVGWPRRKMAQATMRPSVERAATAGLGLEHDPEAAR